jgi:hypothetical protein
MDVKTQARLVARLVVRGNPLTPASAINVGHGEERKWQPASSLDDRTRNPHRVELCAIHGEAYLLPSGLLENS